MRTPPPVAPARVLVVLAGILLRQRSLEAPFRRSKIVALEPFGHEPRLENFRWQASPAEDIFPVHLQNGESTL